MDVDNKGPLEEAELLELEVELLGDTDLDPCFGELFRSPDPLEGDTEDGTGLPRVFLTGVTGAGDTLLFRCLLLLLLLEAEGDSFSLIGLGDGVD